MKKIIFWKLYLYTAMIIIFGRTIIDVYVYRLNGLSVYDILAVKILFIFIESIMLFGLFGFVTNKRIGIQVFWKFSFVVILLYNLDLINFELLISFREFDFHSFSTTQDLVDYIERLVLIIPALIANYFYAYSKWPDKKDGVS